MGSNNLEFEFPSHDGTTDVNSAVIEGNVHRIIFLNEANDYTVASLLVASEPDPVTAVGSFSVVEPGERVKLKGQWVEDARFGRQFKASQFQILYPTTLQGIINFLASERIHGIGPKFAEKIVAVFGVETIEVLSQNPGRLKEVPGLGPKRISQLLESWRSHHTVRDIMMFLQGFGISAAFASRIYKQYGEQATAVVKQNPYRLAEDVSGIGFLSADRIAGAMGIAHNASIRIEAGIQYVLHKFTDNGHVYMPLDHLGREAEQILKVHGEGIQNCLQVLLEQEKLIQVTNTNGEPVLYLRYLYEAETGITSHIQRLKNNASPLDRTDMDALLARAETLSALQFSETQRHALELGLKEKICIITGGPGTGKTTLLHALVGLYQELGLAYQLGAPTGRAARRLADATRSEAKTIHRLLEFNPKFGSFQRGEDKPLEADAVLIDEASMIDLPLFYSLLSAMPDHAVFILIGDADQLPSVGPGTVLRDLIQSSVIPTVHLDTIFRQSEDSSITVNAHRINQGQIIHAAEQPEGHFFFIAKESPEAMRQAIIELASERIPKRFGLDPIRDVQVLSPMYKTLVGVRELNLALQGSLNKHKTQPIRRHLNLAPGDKVMQTSNNYDKEIFNGDIGFVESIDSEARKVRILFDSRSLEFAYPDMDELMLAYAVTIHKAQGSEYEAVILPVTTAHYTMLQRNLLYTAVTRAKTLCVLVGQPKALNIAIKNNHIDKRYSDLHLRLREEEF